MPKLIAVTLIEIAHLAFTDIYDGPEADIPFARITHQYDISPGLVRVRLYDRADNPFVKLSAGRKVWIQGQLT